jgi:hypothetical protein
MARPNFGGRAKAMGQDPSYGSLRARVMSMSLSGDAFERAVLEKTVADLAADGSELCDTTPWTGQPLERLSSATVATISSSAEFLISACDINIFGSSLFGVGSNGVMRVA